MNTSVPSILCTSNQTVGIALSKYYARRCCHVSLVFGGVDVAAYKMAWTAVDFCSGVGYAGWMVGGGMGGLSGWVGFTRAVGAGRRQAGQ